MLNLPSSLRIFWAVEPCDMRKQFNGLEAMVRHAMQRDPQNGELFVFYNQRRDFIKILLYDTHGFCPLVKHYLSDGTTIAMEPKNGSYGRVNWSHQPNYSGEGTLSWPDGSTRTGIFQQRIVTYGPPSLIAPYILTEADNTTHYFNLGEAYKPYMATRVIAKPQTIVVAPSNLMEL